MFNINFNGVNNPSFIKIKAVDFTAFPINGSGSKLIKCEFSLIKDMNKSLLEMSRDLSTWLLGSSNGYGELVISEDSSVSYTARVLNTVEIKDLMFLGSGVIEFEIPSGVAKTSNKTVNNSGNTVTIPYKGNTVDFPIITVVPKNNFTGDIVLTCPTNNTKIHLKGNFISGKSYVVDCGKKVVKVNGVKDLTLIQITTEWILLSPNSSNRINLNREDITVSVTYKDCYV